MDNKKTIEPKELTDEQLEKKLNEMLEKICASLTDEQKEKVKDCKDVNEFISALGEMGVALPDELLEAVAGGDMKDFVFASLQPRLTLGDDDIVKIQVRHSPLKVTNFF